jgi:hypothetical protein
MTGGLPSAPTHMLRKGLNKNRSSRINMGTLLTFLALLTAVAAVPFLLSFMAFLATKYDRFGVAIVCTAFSCIALWISFLGKVPLWITSWVMYFVILYFWIRYNRAPKALLIVGTSMGIISIISSSFLALIFAFPSIVLMFHVIKCSFFSVSSNTGVEQDVPPPYLER